MNLYIESLEGGYYVVATGEQDNRKPLMASQDKPKTFNSIDEIRTHFEDKTFDEVWLRQATPYEEMVGQADNDSELEIEIKW
ncbi:NADH-quinone reductase [Salinimonas sp. HHU 13199]|uniref:NADH-quinone reductase n=1 Tax=Salinimonas profundi TaxID=2729140 RepID=A0ABR8LFG0_9ALTE|nr:DUF6482 family protein [Salinimonas profundi]MBD3584995.1 NADH-quinone reductase [Salinimonas profundi]